ncbi:unnamed protein product [Acanthoscelides obtectus]|nr:unnamed protein product [Acanthoscelides obtectus]CAK1632643.1 Vacuolar protein sorting-associated protein 13 [Acanthoscelides obtectus]
MLQVKQAELRKIEEAEKMEEEKDQPQQDPNLAQRFLFAMIRNIQLTIKNVHIRYEDKVTSPSSPFSFGFTLGNLLVESTDQNWKVCFIDSKDLKEPVSRFYKTTQLDSLAMYWNSHSETYSHLPMAEMHKHLSKIAKQNSKPDNYRYILGPMNLSARMRVNLNPERDEPKFSYPKLHLNVEISKLYLGITKNQYRDLIALTDSMGRMAKGEPYRKYRPNVTSYHGHYAQWWRFAYTSILEEHVRKKRREWNWENILKYRNMCRKYKELYQKSKTEKNMKPEEKKTLEDCEKKMNVINIVVTRKQVEVELKKMAEEAGKQSFFSRWWGSSGSDSTHGGKKTSLVKEIEDAMTPEEKQKLYKAVGVTEDGKQIVNYPETYISISCAFVLKSFEVEMKDEETAVNRVLFTTLNTVRCKVEMRPYNSGLKVLAQIDDLETIGMKQPGDFIPKLITKSTGQKGLLDVVFEMNPIDESCDQRIDVSTQPLKITYDAETINKVVEIFKLPSDTSLDQIQIAAENRLNKMKEMTTTGLAHAIDKQICLNVNIDIQAPYIIIPYGGKYTGSENVLVANLGHLKIFSFGKRSSTADLKRLHEEGKTQTEIMEHLVKHAYDNFKLEFKNLQILMAQSDENWDAAIKNSMSTDMHLLNPLSISFTYSKCVISDDPKLPHGKVKGQLPSIDVKLSEARILMLFSLIFSITWPSSEVQSNEIEAITKFKRRTSSTMLNKYKELQDRAKKTQNLIQKLPRSASQQEMIQFTTIEAVFEMAEITLRLNKQESVASDVSELATFKLNSLICSLTMKTFETSVSLQVGNIIMQQPRAEDRVVRMIDSPIPAAKDEYLFKVEFTQVDPASPGLHSVHKSVESCLSLNLGQLYLTLHQEAVLSLLEFSTIIQEEMARLREQNRRDRYATTKKTMSVISERFENAQKVVGAHSNRKKKSAHVETIKFKLIVHLNELTLQFETDKSNISSCSVQGINTTIILKESYTEVEAKLMDVVIIDLDPNTLHPLILSGSDDIALTLQLVMYNLTNEQDKPDMDVDVKVGGSRIVFLNKFITSLLGFLNQFQDAQKAIIEASQAAAETAKENMKDVYDKATKISLSVQVKAPDIIVPMNSKSYDAMSLDLGTIKLLNHFITLEAKNDENYHAIVDNLKISLTDLKITRIKIGPKHDVANECNLLEPVTFNLNVKRNLSLSWYKDIPDLDISGDIKMIRLKLGQIDYQLLMSILNGNLAEGRPEKGTDTKASEMIEDTHGQKLAATSNVCAQVEHVAQDWKDKEKPTVFMNFTFKMDILEIDLYQGDMKTLSPTSEGQEKTHLGRFSLEGLSVKGKILSDESLVTSVLLLNCYLDDMRKGKEAKLNRMIQRSFDPSKACVADDASVMSTSSNLSYTGPVRSMFDITYQQKRNEAAGEKDKHDEMFADVRIYSFTLILSVEYLMKIADFFNMKSAETDDAATQTQGRQNTSSVTTAKSLQSTGSASSYSQQADQKNTYMTINLKLEQPDIILVEDMESINTNCMILNAEILVKLRMAGEHQVVNGMISDLQVYTCNYNPAKRVQTRNNVLHPVTVSLAGSTPEDKGLHIELMITDVHLSVSPSTIELLNRVLVTMTKGGSSDKEKEIEEIYYENIWEPKSFDDPDFWFLKTEYGTDALDQLMHSQSIIDSRANQQTILQELCIISIPTIIVTVEAGVGNKTLPMLMLETGLKGSVKNWSSQLGVEASMKMQMGYYNSRLALWEPLIEPVENVCGNTNRQVITPWELKLEVSMNQEQDDNMSSMSPTDSEADMQLPQPLMDIDVMSENNLELTITKTLLEVLTNLGKAFTDAVSQNKFTNSHSVEASYKVVNEIGEDITLLLEESAFNIVGGGDKLDINKSQAVPLVVKPNFVEKKTLDLGKELVKNAEKKNKFLHIKVNSKKCELALPVVRADKRFFLLNYRSSSGSDNWGIVSDVRVDEGITTIIIRSILQVINHFNTAIDVYYMTPKGNILELIGVVQPNSHLNVPLKAVYNPTNELFFGVSGYSVTSSPYVWKDLQTFLDNTKILNCRRKSEEYGEELFVIKAVGEMEQIYYENTARHTMSSVCFNIHLRPAVIFKNCLPLDIVCCVDEKVEEFTVKAGDILQLPSVTPGSNVIVIRLPDYLEKEWSCRGEILEKPNEFTVWTFNSYDSPTKMSMDLGMHSLDKNGSLVMSLYCPFWMLNKTGLMLAYRKSKKTEKRDAAGSPAKSTDESMNILHHPPDFKGPILFSFSAKNFFGKKKACVKVEGGEWSDRFSLDTAGSSGVIACKTEGVFYQIGVNNQLTYNSLTKQVTFTPFYVIINNAPYTIECQESDRPADHWTVVGPKSCTALWPKTVNEDKLLRLRIDGTDEISAPFLYTESHNTLLRLDNKYGGMNVDIQLTEGSVYINLAPYDVGSAPALLVNHTSVPICYWEKESVQKRILLPKHSILYTWENPSGPRIIAWDRGHKKEIFNDLRKDGGGEFSPEEDLNICWVSFLDGMQRVLLFTESRSIVTSAQVTNILEVIQQEINMSIQGVGISFVNNATRKEIMYIGIASSGVIWEVCKHNSTRYKQLSTKESTHIEVAYQAYLVNSLDSGDEVELGRIAVSPKMEVDFKTGQMFKPHKRKLRRTYQTGLWFQMKTSPSQMQLHAKVNKLQIDNQMFDCIFPVVLAPVPPPRSVAIDSGIKPFVEVSIVQLLLKNSQIKQYKYFKILVQEFHVKVDLGFVNAVLELLQQEETSEEGEKELFLKDMTLVDEPLYSHASSKSIEQQKNFFDLLHFSPFKIHLSFSMAAGSSGQNASTPTFLNILLQGVGVTLTDLQDVIFKLAYFERDYTFLTRNQLISETTSHYVGQFVKQLYVLVLGLDLIGNPYGLVIGITKGVEDLFYEPFQGAIQGPGEFAEGLALGVKSLFGHTVGGTAGAFSRITGAMGKGIAALTFDEDFQRKRREAINKKPATVQEGLARSGKGLVMGVYSGLTGVFTKPVTGAKEQGVEGFFKGLGKGAVGLVTRPVAGVVDFASGSLEAVKRVTESGEEATRLRPPRFLHNDGLVRPYDRREAEGNRLLMEISKGKYATTDVYVMHYVIVPDKEMVLLSDRRLAYIVKNDLFGGWQVEWSYTWDEIPEPAKVVTKGVLIATSKEKKKLFGTNGSSKLILLNNPEQKEDLCVKIESMRRLSQ